MKTADLRVIKTEQQIEQAFLKLLQQKNYRAITVQDILDTALINRSTFYRHYKSKAELADYLVQAFRQQYEAFLQKRFANHPHLSVNENLLLFINEFLVFLHSQKQKILALWQINTPTIHLYDDMYALIKQQFTAYAHAQQSEGNIPYQGHMYASLVLAHLRYFLENDSIPDIRHTRQQLMQMFTLTGVGLGEHNLIG